MPETPLPDWKALGLRSGVEIHQQLLTKSKLFCRCPAGLYTDRHDAEVIRHMRPTLSELGEYDGTALMEFKTKKEILYLLTFASVCTYEMDDTPPFEIDREAIDIALEIAIALNCNIVGELHVARKQYLDGSIPTGFQRTAIVGVDGWVPYKDRRIRIAQVSVEEDSCREVSDRGHRIVFRTDRLSMPLAEVVTYPDMRTPEEVAEVTDLLGSVMRKLGRVRRGAGATRQDVNVSVEGGTRVEIKGVPSIRLIADLVAHEGIRQRALLDMAEALTSAGSTGERLECSRFDATRWLATSRSELLRKAAGEGQRLGGICLKGMAAALTTPLGPTRSFAEELEGRVRVIACLDERPILLHDGNLAAFGLTGAEWKRIRHNARARRGDALVIARGGAEDVETALNEVEARAREAFLGVPSETRQVLVGGETDFERILPGPDRMYPDTDSAPVPVPDDWVEALTASQPLAPWESADRLRAAGFTEAQAKALVVRRRDEVAIRLTSRGAAPALVVRALLQDLPALSKRRGQASSLSEKRLEEVVSGQADGLFAREVFADVAIRAAESDAPLGQIVAELGLHPPLEGADLEEAVESLLGDLPEPRATAPEARLRHAMGHVMSTVRGRAPGRSVRSIVARHLS